MNIKTRLHSMWGFSPSERAPVAFIMVMFHRLNLL